MSVKSSEILSEPSLGRSWRAGAAKWLATTTAMPYFIALAVMFVLIVGSFRYTATFNEGDLYRVLLGLLNGKASGLWLHDPTQYGTRFGYGYVAMIYWLGEAHILNINDRESLIAGINAIGFIASVATVAFLMASLRAMYDAPTALLACALFILSPIFLELAASGHQLTIALAFFFAANLLLVLDIRGRWIAVSYVTAMLLLFAGLTMRAELPLAFSWLAFAQRPRAMLTHRQYILGVVSRSMVCLLAFALFQIVYRFEVYSPSDDAEALSGLSAFLSQFYHLSYVIRGCVILVVGCGLATVAVGAASLIVEGNGLARRFRWPEAVLSAPNWLGPVTLILVGTIFWLPNPYPARHFTFVLLGLAVLIAIWTRWRFHLNSAAAMAVGLILFVSNQALAEAIRPLVLRNLHSLYVKLPEHSPTTGMVPLGSFVRYHASLSERWAVLTNFGRMVTRSCEPRLLILTGNGPLMAGLMLKPDNNARASSKRNGTYVVLKVLRNHQTFLFVDPQEIWPRDPVSVILSDPELDGYQILRDPYSMSTHDRLAVPAARAANYPSSESTVQCDGDREEPN